MKQLSQLPVVKEISASKPFGAIINETDTEGGTPVVREIYNDHLINTYKLLEVTGITPDGTEDGETNGGDGGEKYQVLDALKTLPSLYGIEQDLYISGSIWVVNLNLAILPDRFYFIARATDNYASGTTFQGQAPTPEYTFTSDGFNANDEVLVIVDQSQVRAYKLSSGSNTSGVNEVLTVFGMPVPYNDNDNIFSQENGTLISDIPSVGYIQDVIRTELADTEVLVTEMFVKGAYLLCVVFIPNTEAYVFRQFGLGDLTQSDNVPVSGATFPTGADREPYFYYNGTNLYVTNQHNTTASDNAITVFEYLPETPLIRFLSENTVDATFVKTSNAAIKNNVLYTFTGGELKGFDLVAGTVSNYGIYSGVIGTIFGYKGDVFFTSGEVGKKIF